ncbi:MAG: Si-specific NAD(P)(+) transhydrogenase [Planctomycetia bacterium]
MRHFDVVVIGTGPAGQKAAIQSAKLGKKVALVERRELVGGVCLHTGTIPSKALREAVLQLTTPGLRSDVEPVNHRKITITDVAAISNRVIRTEMMVISNQLERNGIELLHGLASFEAEPHVLSVTGQYTAERISGDYFVIATGTRPARTPEIPFNETDVIDSDGLLNLPYLPRSMIIVGGGVIGTEYACILAQLGVRVTLVEGRDMLLEFADREIVEALQYHMRQIGITLRMGERVERVETIDAPGLPPDHHGGVKATLASGKAVKADTLMHCVGRVGNTSTLSLDKVGIKPDDRGRIAVNSSYQSEKPHIYAVGDVIGFPALASTAMEQGRLAACHMFGEPAVSMPSLFPYGIYSIPEISMVGMTEKQLTSANVPYEAGVARYREIARGQLLGDESGMLKILVHQETRAILGVHIIGTGATELVHIGQCCMAMNGTVDFFVHNVFNYPTLAEAYKIAAFNVVNRLSYC